MFVWFLTPALGAESKSHGEPLGSRAEEIAGAPGLDPPPHRSSSRPVDFARGPEYRVGTPARRRGLTFRPGTIEVGDMKQQIRFCATPDGTRIAYATVGQGVPLVKAANWLSHLEYDWESPLWRHMLEGLARDYLLVRYDERGTGLSDREAKDLSFESWVHDLGAVVDALGLQRFALLGISQGGPVAITYAGRHPERVSHLILYGTYARGRFHRGDGERDVADALTKLMRKGWGVDNPAFRELFASFYVPEGTPEQLRWFSELERVSASPETAARIFLEIADINIVEALPRVEAPTLILHCRGDRLAPFDLGRELAAMIPGARFVPLEGNNHLILEDEPARDVFFREVSEFLGSGRRRLWAGGTRPHRRFRRVVQSLEANPLYRVLAMAAALASVVSLLLWFLTR